MGWYFVNTQDFLKFALLMHAVNNTYCYGHFSGRSSLLPVVGHSNIAGNSWKLDPHMLTFQLKGLLPFEKVRRQGYS